MVAANVVAYLPGSVPVEEDGQCSQPRPHQRGHTDEPSTPLRAVGRPGAEQGRGPGKMADLPFSDAYN